MKKIAIFLIFLFLYLYAPQKISARNFSTDYFVTYSILQNADTKVVLNVVLTNLTENYYASSYDITVGFKDIRDLSGSDQNGPILPSIEKEASKAIIHIPFNNKVIGLNNKLSFNIDFKTNEIANNLENIWDVNIPGISSQNDFSNFQARVIYPTSLGKPTYIKPNLPNIVNQSSASSSIVFTKEDLGQSGISIAFGDFQTYNFDLIYHIANPNLFTTETEIALPPSTNYQDVYIDSIIPKPENVYLDKDGNWLAKFILPPSKKENVRVKGNVNIHLNPKKEEMPKELIKNYLAQQNYWESNSPGVLAAVKKLKTPKEIYDYVVNTLKYDYSRVENNQPRLGAARALTNPSSAVCLEFTDLFIALSRAARIPARQVSGYAFTDNTSQRPLSLVKDVLHAWPEYYDFEKSTWIMVDPTWGNTTGGVDYFNTLDFDHFTFVINGQNSSYPIPAGGYKFTNDLNSKDVNVTLAKQFNPVTSPLEIKLIINKEFLSGFPITGNVQIKNTGQSISETNQLLISSTHLTPSTKKLIVNKIPPFGYLIIPISFNKTSILTNQADTIRIQFGENTVYKNINIYPFFLSKIFLLGGILFVSFIFILSAAYIGYRRLSFLRQERQSNILRQSDKSS